MSTVALAKPVRVIHELTATEQFIRATERAKEIRDAARARLDADFVERIEDARARYLAPLSPIPAAPEADGESSPMPA